MCGLGAFVTVLHPSRTNSVLQRGTVGLYLMLFAFIVVVDAHLVLGEYLGIHSCHGERLEKREVLAHSRAGLWPGAKPRDKMSHVHPRAWWEWEQECCVLAGLMEEACEANTAFVLPKSTGLHCAPLCIHVLLYFLYKCCFFPPERAVERCIALYPSFMLALFLVSFPFPPDLSGPEGRACSLSFLFACLPML